MGEERRRFCTKGWRMMLSRRTLLAGSAAVLGSHCVLGSRLTLGQDVPAVPTNEVPNNFAEFTHESVRNALRKGTAAIVATQSPDGHWGNQSWAPTLGTVMGWVALRAAHYAGIKVGNSPETTAKHLVQQMSTSLAHESGSWMHTL